MKILLFGDVHWSTYSSIVRSREDVFSTRLKFLINSMNWVEQIAIEQHCDRVYGLGDFFDQPTLNAEEISALACIRWADIPHFFICGNHELGLDVNNFSSAALFTLRSNFHFINTCTDELVDDIGTHIVCVPYHPSWTTNNPKDMELVTQYVQASRRSILLSHNDIQGVQMGPVISKVGIPLKWLEDHTQLTVNGHYHNGETVSRNVINIGNLTGQNFGEDAEKYSHKIFILDTDTIKLETYKNPYALFFYKFNFTHDLKIEIEHKLSSVTNAVLSITCIDSDVNWIKHILENNESVVTYKLCVQGRPFVTLDESAKRENLYIDHLKEFYKYVMNTMGRDEITVQELSEVIK